MWGGGCTLHMLTMSTYLRWMDVGDISEKVLNEGEDILQKVFNEVWKMHMLKGFL